MARADGYFPEMSPPNMRIYNLVTSRECYFTSLVLPHEFSRDGLFHRSFIVETWVKKSIFFFSRLFTQGLIGLIISRKVLFYEFVPTSQIFYGMECIIDF